MPRPTRTVRGIPARLVLGVAFALVLLATTEAGLRIAGVQPAYKVEALGQWRVAGNLDHQSMSGPRDGHAFHLSTNPDGLRTSIPLAKTPGVLRVVVMGDSTVFGWGVDDGETVVDGIQAAIGPTIEVLNAGQPGYSTTMAAWLYGQAVSAYQPDLTVVFIPMHDTNLVLVSDREVLDGGATTTAKVRVLLARESRVYQVLRGMLFDLTDRAWLLPSQSSQEPRVPRVSDAERTLAIRAMAATAAGWGGRVTLGYLPFKGDIEDGGRMQRPTQAWAEAYASGHDVPLIDAHACCAGQTGLVLEDDPGHLSATGNQQAGAAIAEQLRLAL